MSIIKELLVTSGAGAPEAVCPGDGGGLLPGRGEAQLLRPECGGRGGGGHGLALDAPVYIEDVCQQNMSILPVKLLYVPRPEAGGGAGHG